MWQKILVLPLLFGFFPPAAKEEDPESIEPSFGYVLEIGDESIVVQDDEPVTLKGSFVNPKVKVTTEQFRTFPYAGLSFQYPVDFTFEADFNDNRRIWRLVSADVQCGLQINSYEGKVTVAEVVESVTADFGKVNSQVTDVSITLGEHKLKGQRVQAKVEMFTKIYEIYSIPTAGSKFLIISTVLQEDGSPPDERQYLVDYLKESFAIKKPKKS